MSRPAAPSPACLRFRVAYPDALAGVTGPARHRDHCAPCAAWAAALDDARRPAPLPAALRARLLAIPGRAAELDPVGVDEAPPVLAAPLTPAPLPPALRERLVAIGREPVATSHRPPSWLLDLRPLLAASYLLACLMGALAGGFQAFGAQALESSTRLASAVQTSTRALQGQIEEAPVPSREGLWRVVDPVVTPLGEWKDTVDRTTGEALGEIERRWRRRFPARTAPDSLESPTPPAPGPERDDETPGDPRPRQVHRPSVSPEPTEALS
jgi:hypothetical protein